MSFEIVWGILPLGIAVVTVFASWLSAATRPRFFLQWALLVPVPVFCGSAAFILFRMLRGAWPAFVPHVLIAAAVLLVLMQLGLRRVGRP